MLRSAGCAVRSGGRSTASHRGRVGFLRSQAQHFAVGKIEHAGTLSHVGEDFLKAVPELQFVHFPGMPIKMPDSTFSQDTVKKRLGQVDPVS